MFCFYKMSPARLRNDMKIERTSGDVTTGPADLVFNNEGCHAQIVMIILTQFKEKILEGTVFLLNKNLMYTISFMYSLET